MPFVSINPANNQLLKTYESLTAAEVEERLNTAVRSFQKWRNTTYKTRANALRKAAEILLLEKAAIAATVTAEMGKPIAAAIAETEKCALACQHYAENGERYLADEDVPTNASRSFVRYQPLGVILAVMPWNFPLWQVFRFAVPTLFAGNVALLKHAPSVPQCALLIESVFRRAGFPEGVFQNLFIEVEQIRPLLEDPRVAAATLTGSEAAGRSMAQIAGSQIKKTVLELGGSDPFIVMPSAMANEELTNVTVNAAVKARVINSGQSCIAAKRFLVAESVYDEFARRFTLGMQALKSGDPTQQSTDLGPIATSQLLDNLHSQVERAVASGAHVLTGGRKIPGPGNFYEPTVLANVNRSIPVYYEEFFGPVAMLFKFKTIEEAIDIANDTTYGLAASVWSQDEQEQNILISGLEAGCVFVNSSVASDVRLPFGGIKRSGYGRELGLLGIREFVNIKTVWVK